MATINLSEYKPLHINNAEELSIGIVFSDWNDFITHSLRDAALEILEKEGVKKENIQLFKVPGAFELSYASMQLCKTQKFDAVIAIGCVIRGETPHFDYVCSAVAQGIKDCNILTDTPTIFCVLTDDSKEQSIARSGGNLGNKGIEAAVTALQMINFKKLLQMKWTNDTSGGNVEDRRGKGNGGVIFGGGLGTLVIAAIVFFLGGNPSELLSSSLQQSTSKVQRE